MASLSTLAPEVFEMIVGCLDIKSICNLRLASRETAANANQTTFQSYFRKKRVLVTRNGLEDLAQHTSEGHPGCSVESLTLVGIVYVFQYLEDVLKSDRIPPNQQRHPPATPEELLQAKCDYDMLLRQHQDWLSFKEDRDDHALLRRAFGNIKTHGRSGLKRLSIEIGFFQMPGLGPLTASEAHVGCDINEAMCSASSETFNLVLTSIMKSELSVQALDIHASEPAALRCSLPCDAFRQFLVSNSDLSPMLNILSLSVKYTDPLFSGDQDDLTALMTEISGESHVLAPSDFLRACPNLEELSLGRSSHQYRRILKMQHYYNDSLHPMHLEGLAHHMHLPRLRRLHLGGLRGDAAHFITILNAHRNTLRIVELTSLHVVGWVSSLINPLRSSDQFPALESIRLDYLVENGHLLIFDGQQNQPFTTISGEGIGRNVIHCWGEDIRKRISYYRAERRERYAVYLRGRDRRSEMYA